MFARHRSLLLPLLTTGPVLALLAWWALDGGGYFPSDWLPGIVVVFALLAVAVVGLGTSFRSPSAAVTAAVWLLGAYSLWSFASILWADVPAAALEGAQRTLLYFGAFTLLALVPWTIAAARVAIVAVVVTGGVVGAITLARVAAADEPLRMFVDARLAAPLGYQNATAALWTMGALPGLVLASRRETAPFLRPVLLAVSGLLLALALMAESRGWLFTMPLILLLMLAVVPGRVRLLVFALPVVAALALAAGAILEVYRVAGGLTPAEAARVAGAPIDHAVAAVALVALGLLLAGIAMTVVEQRLLPRLPIAAKPPPKVSRAMAATAVVVLVLGGGAVAATQDLPGRVDRAWSQFRDPDTGAPDRADVRFTSLGSGRYDFWRVALNVWREHPIGGAGQDNFAQPYVAARRTFEEPRWVHSLPLRLLAHTGIVGALLFAGFVLALAWAAAQPWRRRRPAPQRAVLAAAVLPVLVWLVHGSVDWLWEYPVLSVLALATAGIAVSCAGERADERGTARRRATPLCIAAALAAAVLVAPSYVAGRDVRDAAARWPADPAAALDRLRRAQSLDLLAAQPLLVEGVIDVQIGRPAQARRALLRARSREPRNWVVSFMLGLTADRSAGVATAARYLADAHRLNPREPTVTEARSRLSTDGPMTLAEANRVFQARTRARQGR